LDQHQTTWAFALAIFTLGIGRRDRRPLARQGRAAHGDDRRRRAVGLGNLLAGLGIGTLGAPWLYLAYGMIGGFGNGMAYITPVATVTKWFPDKRGLGSGIVVMGFGLGAFFYNQIVSRSARSRGRQTRGRLHAASDAAKKAGTAFDVTSIPQRYRFRRPTSAAIAAVFVVSGIVFIIVGGLCASLLSNPPAGYTVPGAVAAASAAGRSFTPGEVLRTPQFYLLWLMLFLNVTAGILVVSNAVPILSDLTGATAAVAGQVYGLLAIFNGLGRFFWGAVSDRIGRNLAYVLIFGLQVIVFFILGKPARVWCGRGACFALVLLCYGGGFGTMPSFNADYFGTKYLGVNYGMIITAWGFGGLVGPLVAAKVKDVTGSFTARVALRRRRC
jgi:OFA family oxalate/formate antiporter-like MFS transporter